MRFIFFPAITGNFLFQPVKHIFLRLKHIFLRLKHIFPRLKYIFPRLKYKLFPIENIFFQPDSGRNKRFDYIRGTQVRPILSVVAVYDWDSITNQLRYEKDY